MTTIAWDGKTLAVDSRATSDGYVMTDKCKKLYTGVGQYVAAAMCGDEAEAVDMMDWLRTGGKAPECKEGVIIVAVMEDGTAHKFTGGIETPIKVQVPYADGSGWIVALASMDAGLNAVEAVKAARKRDIYTGGPVKSFKIGADDEGI